MADIVQPDIALRDLEGRWGVARNTLKNWATKLGIEIKNPTPRSAYWPGEYIDLGDQLAAWLRAGNDLGAFPYICQVRGNDSSLIPQQPAASKQTEETAITPTAGSQLAKHPADSELTDGIQHVETSEVADDPHAAWDDVAKAMSLDEYGRPRWYSNAEMAQILRLSKSTVEGYKTGFKVFPGVLIEKDEARGRTWCRLYPAAVTDRPDMSGPTSLTAVPDTESKPYVPMGDLIGRMVVDVQAVDCTGSSLMRQNTIRG